jgi:single-strand DNA-binding protein
MTKNPMEFGSGENIGARFTIAVDEWNGKENKASFFDCKIWKKGAEKVLKNYAQGDYLIVAGKIVQNSYTNKEGNKVNTFEVIVDNVEAIIKKNANHNAPSNNIPNDEYTSNDEEIKERILNDEM